MEQANYATQMLKDTKTTVIILHQGERHEKNMDIIIIVIIIKIVKMIVILLFITGRCNEVWSQGNEERIQKS